MPTVTSLFTTYADLPAWSANVGPPITGSGNAFADDGLLAASATSIPDSETLIESEAILLKGTSFAIPSLATITAIRLHAIDAVASVALRASAGAYLIVNNLHPHPFEPQVNFGTSPAPWFTDYLNPEIPTPAEANDPDDFGVMFFFNWYGGAESLVTVSIDQLYMSITYDGTAIPKFPGAASFRRPARGGTFRRSRTGGTFTRPH